MHASPVPALRRARPLRRLAPVHAAHALAMLAFVTFTGGVAAAEGLRLPERPLGATPRAEAGTALRADDPRRDGKPAWGERKSYVIPALEILGFDALLNQFDRWYFGCCDFNSNTGTIRRNLKSGWKVDSDGFTVNQIGHPYQGSMYHGFARASGLGYWAGLGYTFAGSAAWEIAGEATPPSKNDQISTGIGGSFLGEALFRMSSLWLEQGPGSKLWREVVATAISPPVGFNRLAFGDRFDGIFPSRDPEYYGRLQAGVASATQEGQSGRDAKRTEGILDFALEYGLPGKRDYRYDRPFDYFAFQASASSAIGFESISTRGLLYGTDYALGTGYRGIWGVYGSYDYMAPQVFRLASTAVSLGTTAEWRLSERFALQGTVLAGVGYTTVSTIRGAADERSNSYGTSPQALAALRLVIDDRGAFEIGTRQYYVSGVSGVPDANDKIIRADATLTWRIHKQHAIALKYRLARRDSEFPDTGERVDSRQTVGLFYVLLGKERFGTGEWR